MRPEQLSMSGVGNHLHKAGRIAESVGFSVGAEREGRDATSPPRDAALARACSSVGRMMPLEVGRRSRVAYRVIVDAHRGRLCDRLCGDDALGFGDMGQHHLRRDVADCVDAGH